MKTILVRPPIMSREWEKTLPGWLQDYIQAQRQAERAAVIAELRSGELNFGEPPQPEARPAAPKAAAATFLNPKQTPRGLGLRYVTEAIHRIQSGTIISTTDIRTLVHQQTGTKLSFNTVRRAVEKLVDDQQLEKIEGTEGYRVLPRLRSVKFSAEYQE